jgi:hypothetical protein
MISCANETFVAWRNHNCSFASACPVCLNEKPCPPLIVLAVLEEESRRLSTEKSGSDVVG